MKSGTAKIRVDTPCTENWEGMHPNEMGRHCEKCAKTVVDFTTMPNDSIIAYLSQNKHTCGRFYAHQLDKDIPVTVRSNYLTSTWRKWGLAGLFAFQFWPRESQAQNTASDTMPATDTPRINIAANTIDLSFTRTIKGRVIQPDTLAQRARQLKFSIDTFSIAIDVDSSGVFSFQFPAGLPADSAKLDVVANDGQYNAYGLTIYKAYLHQEQLLVFNQKWTCSYNIVFKMPDTILWGPPIIMGGGWSEYKWPQIKWPAVFVDTTLTTIKMITLGDTVIVDSAARAREDSLFKAKLKKQQEALLQKKNANQYSGWWWLLLPVALIMLLVTWVSRGDRSTPAVDDEDE